MFATYGRGHRLSRRRWISLPIGWFCGLVLAGSWAHKEVFWWPLFGADRPHVALLPAVPLVVLEEVAGIAAAVWCYRRFGLADRRRREQFLRSGRVGVVPS
jgi:hypothetical protein